MISKCERLTCEHKQGGGDEYKIEYIEGWKQDKVALMPMSQKQVVCLAQGGAAQRCVWRICNLITSIVQSLFHHPATPGIDIRITPDYTWI